MADNDSGDKTEKPTAKRLKDSREKGDVPKSRELTSTAGLILWLALGSALTGYATVRIGVLFDSVFQTIGAGWLDTGYAGAVRLAGSQSIEAGIMLSAMLLIPATIVGLFSDFIQTGPILAFEKAKPKMDHLNPVDGVKRMFSMDNLIEVIKALAKTTLLLIIGWLVVQSALPQIVMLARSPDMPVGAISAVIWDLTLKLVGWSVGLFFFISLLDASYQRYSFTKKMRMSMRDIKDEAKNAEGDPMMKGKRRQMHQEWSEQSNVQSARDANVLLVNPTHIAIAIDYDKENNPVPCIAAKAQGDQARMMREAAEEAGTPILRNIPLARDLFSRGEVGELVPGDLFEIIAEVILWAKEAREHSNAQRDSDNDPTATQVLSERSIAAPGEDLTCYNDGPDSYNALSPDQ